MFTDVSEEYSASIFSLKALSLWREREDITSSSFMVFLS
jgi:hypothetical protein